MPRYIALLRGVNLGGHTVKMVRLKELFEELGFKKVETFIASGNVIFESGSTNPAALEKRISAHLEKSLGFPAKTFLRTDEQLAEVIEHDACKKLGTRVLYIGFLVDPLSKESSAKLMAHSTKSDEFHVNGREVYWRCRSGMAESPFLRIGIEKATGVKATLRNVTTVSKLVAKYPAKKRQK